MNGSLMLMRFHTVWCWKAYLLGQKYRPAGDEETHIGSCFEL